MTGSRLLIVNHFHTDYELQILWPRSPRQPTTPIRIPMNGAVDVLPYLRLLTKDQARAVVENSPDYMKARAKFRLDIVDEANPPEAPVRLPPVVPTRKNGLRFLPEPLFPERRVSPPVGDDSGPVDWPDALPLPTKPGTTAEDGQRMVEEERRATEAFIEAQRRSRGESKSDAAPGRVTNSTDTEAKEPEAAGALEPGIRDLLEDTLPSSRWTLEKLVEYAGARGIETVGLSKNAVLRKIRGT